MFFKNKKPYLKDLIPNNYVDIHSHLLPTIDDGAKSIENSLELITNLKKFGFSQFITTPHIMKDVWDNKSADIIKLLYSTKIELQKKQHN
jgi:protein-tyrosine phosphatase